MKTAFAFALLVAHVATASPARCEPPLPRQTAPSEFSAATMAAMDEAIRAELAGSTFAGMSVGIRQGSRVWTAAYGQRDLRRRLPATPETTYRLASITKSFTAVAVMQLVEQGQLALDQEIRSVVPNYPEKQWPITIRQLLGHQSGVPHYRNSRDGRNTRRVNTAEAIALFADRPLAAEPGTDFVYTSWGYNLLGAAVETASGLPYDAYLQKHVFGPAGMAQAALDDHRTRGRNHAVGYRRRGERIVPSEFLDVSSRFAGGGTRGSVLDLLAFGRAVLDHRLVSPQTTAQMQTAMATRDGRLIDYGMGFATYPLRGHYLVAHAGGQPETTTFLVLVPAEDLVIALASNLEGEAGLHKRLVVRLLEVLSEDGHVRRDGYAQDPLDRLLYEGLYRIFTYGVAYERWQSLWADRSTLWPEPSQVNLASAFARAAGLLDRTAMAQDPKTHQERLRAAHEPRGERTFIDVGTHMAKTIAAWASPARLAEYPKLGPLAFFADYRKACEARKCPAAVTFAPLDPDLRRLQREWDAGTLEGLRTVRLDEAPASEAEALWAKLEAHAAKSTVHPDYSDEIFRLAERLEAAGKKALAGRWIERAVALHPGAPTPMLVLADHRLRTGDQAGALALYQQAVQADPLQNATSAEALMQRAQRAESKQQAREVLRVATVVREADAALWQALARAERSLGAKREARRALERAEQAAAAAQASPASPVGP